MPRCDSHRSLSMLKHCSLTSVRWLILWNNFQLFLYFFFWSGFFLPMGLPLSEYFATPVYSWCSFTESAYSKMKLLVQNRGSVHTVLICSFGMAFSSCSEGGLCCRWACSRGLRIGWLLKKKKKPQSQRLNTLSRIILLYCLHNKLCFEQYTENY